MFDLSFLLAPIFATFLIGIVLRKTSVLDDSAVNVLLKLVHHLTLPALLLSVLPYVVIGKEVLFLLLISCILVLVTLAATTLTGKALFMPEKSLAVLVIGSTIMNLSFVMPFVQSFYGDDGLARLFVFNIPNELSLYSIAYVFACKNGGTAENQTAKKLIKSPPLLALLAALLLNVLALRPVPIVTAVLHSIGGLTMPLLLLGLGASFRITKHNPLHLAAGIALRMLLGLLLGWWLASLFHLEGLNRAIVVLSASAPAGFNTLKFNSIEKLDREFAATLAASCMIVAMLLIPVLLIIL
jgi:malate permease and related proteins